LEFFLFLNVVSGLLPNGSLNFCIKWKDGCILRSKPLHESDEISAAAAASVLLLMSLEQCSITEGCALDRQALNRTQFEIVRSYKNYVLQN
jgi:hypothetical protein